MNKTKYSKIGFIPGIALLSAFTGCVSYENQPRHARAYAPPPTIYVESEPVMQDDFVYYPGYQVYYSSNRRQYIYLEGRSWVRRPSPPHVSVEVLFASPSVRLDFHDSPAIHHTAVVREYPRHWTPNGRGNDSHDIGQGQGNNKGKRGRD